MEHVPETSDSLIARVQDPADDAAWADFLNVYRPVILRMARRRNLQDADAQDVCQKVLIAVSQAISQWEPHPDRPFRAWLGRVARNAILNAVIRRPKDQATGLSEVAFLLNDVAVEVPGSSAELMLETRRQLFYRASQVVRCEFTDITWRMFWETEVEGRSVDVVGASCGRTPGAVYVARCRVMKRLREYVQNESQIWGVES
ncbi:MAG: sigma-70 family RNA polymerase sigma factor [Planctomycetaceae bacterium]